MATKSHLELAIEALRARGIEPKAKQFQPLLPPAPPPASTPPKKPAASRANKLVKVEPYSFDFSSGAPLPPELREAVEVAMAIEAEDAKTAGALGFMARALVLATMPYKDPKSNSFVRRNGDFTLSITSGGGRGLPYGVYPRLLMSWVTTEAVRTKSPELVLGDTLTSFLRDSMGIRAVGGGPRGAIARVTDQMARLFSSAMHVDMRGDEKRRGIRLRNVMIAESLDIEPDEIDLLDQAFVRSHVDLVDVPGATPESVGGTLWVPQGQSDAGRWKSRVVLTQGFFQECITRPVPMDVRAYSHLRNAPMAMDIYAWLTYRMSYVQKRTHPIPWLSLMLQFGSSTAEVAFALESRAKGKDKAMTPELQQAVRNFKRMFLTNLQLVLNVYPNANVHQSPGGLVLSPSAPSVLPNNAKSFAVKGLPPPGTSGDLFAGGELSDGEAAE